MSYIWILPPPRQRGFLLITGLLITSGLILLTTGSLVRSQVEWTAASRFLAQQQALYLAEGRMEQVVAAFALSPNLAQGTTCPSGVETAGGTTSCTLTPLQLYVNGPGGLTTQPVQILVTATVPNALTPLGRQSLEAVVEVPSTPLFQWAAYGGAAVTLMSSWFISNGIIVDSYDSSRGPYDPLAPKTLEARVQVGDATLIPTIFVGNRSAIWGDALATDLRYITTIGTGRIYGQRLVAPPPAMPAVRTPIGTPRGGVLTSCPSGSETLDVSAFPYSQITLSSPCDLTIRGQGAVFLDDLSMPLGSRLTFDGQIEALGSNFALITNLNGKFHGVVYAPSRTSGVMIPQTWPRFGDPSNEVFGSVVSGVGMVDLGGSSRVHQDLSLKTLGAPIGPSNPVKLRSWRTL
ncbi:MAG: hypothetical protein HYW10_05370 [Candidatus Omnitrophica bacterium]|nr:hypothetical protein [Candidatus Omnitrophota bacterium]